MSAPSYDWLANLTLAQQKYMEDNYSALWSEYKTYGYSVTLYDYARDFDKVYDEVKSVHNVEKVELPPELKDKVEAFYRKQLEIRQLKQIMIPVENYHVLLVTKDLRVDSELRRAVKDVPVVMVDKLTDELLRAGNNCVVFDDVDGTVKLATLEDCEMLGVPYIRRTVAGWKEPVLGKDSENLLLNFIERSRPCKVIR